jgi:hypothetical protein
MRLILMLAAVGVLSGCAGLIKQPQTETVSAPAPENISVEEAFRKINISSERIKFTKGKFSTTWSGKVDGGKFFKLGLKKGQVFSVGGQDVIWRMLKLNGSYEAIWCDQSWCKPNDFIKDLPYSGDYIVQTEHKATSRTASVSFSALSPRANRVSKNTPTSVESDFSDKPVKKAKKPMQAKGNYQCGGKSVCDDMSSCEEAYFYLTSCGLSKLDRNNNGVPCEKICR